MTRGDVVVRLSVDSTALQEGVDRVAADVVERLAAQEDE